MATMQYYEPRPAVFMTSFIPAHHKVLRGVERHGEVLLWDGKHS
jgi:hypothetical protein